MDCVIHYNQIKFSKKLTKVRGGTFEILKQCKNIRAQLGGDNFHLQQCQNIPVNFETDLFYHRECYQKFTYAKTLLKRKTESDAIQRKSARLENSESQSIDSSSVTVETRKTEENRRDLFPENCMICHQHRIKVNGQNQYPTKILTNVSQVTLKKAAESANDFEMLGVINNVCLIAKEFKKHEKCYRDYTRSIYDGKDVLSEEIKSSIYNQGDYNKVCRIIDTQIIAERKCLSMESLLQVYGI